MSYRIAPERCWQRSLAPGLSPPRSEAPLHLIEWCALWLIQADPRLSARNHRQRLRRLMAMLDVSFEHHLRVGEAVVRLRDLQIAGALDTRGFSKLDVTPSTAEREVAFMATQRAFGRHMASEDKVQLRREAFYALMDGPLPPLAPVEADGHQGGAA